MKNVTNALKVLVAVMLSVFLTSATLSAQTTLLQEGFESGAMPVGWSHNIVSGTYSWIYNAAGGYSSHPAAAHTGSYNARYYAGTYSGAKAELITPVINFTGYTTGQLKFWHTQADWGGDQDSLTVYYRETAVSTWKKLAIYTSSITTWTEETIALPNLTSTYQINFRGGSDYGYGVCLDDVLVLGSSGPPPPPPPATVTVGTGTTTVGYPYSTYWHDGRTQLLYTATEIIAAGGAPGEISTIGFNVSSYSSQLMNGFNVRLLNTTATSVTSWQTGMTTVYSGTYTVPGTGWRMITLQTPFLWDGSNLLLEICFDNTSYTSYSYVYGTAETGKAIYYYTDGAAGCSFTTANTGTTRANLRFVVQPFVGTLTGTVKNCYNNTALAGVTVTIGSLSTTTNAFGGYNIYNVPTGNYNVTYSLAGFVTETVATTITNNTTTTNDLCLDPAPGVLSGVVTNAANGAPIIGAKVMFGSLYTYTTTGGVYTLNVYPAASGVVTFSKSGFLNFVSASQTVTPPATVTLNAAMLEDLNPPRDVVAALNTGSTAVNLNWGLPFGVYEMLYDDGIQDNFTVWADANNLNAVKLTPVGYPATLIGGKVNVGTLANYAGATFPLPAFQVVIFAGDGPGGIPGTAIDTFDVAPANGALGWIDLPAMNIPVASGSIYIAMKQGGIPPQAYGLAIDETSPQLRSYERFVTGGAPWIPAAGNFMIRGIFNGANGPVPDMDNTGDMITGMPSPGAIYEHPMANVTGYEGQGTVLPYGDSPDVITGYQVWRLKQGQETQESLWSSIGTPTATSMTDNGWPTLACAPWRWAVKTQYTGNRWSNAAFSNVLGKCWTANVDVCVTLTCAANLPEGTIVKLTNITYPDTNYTMTTDTTGCVHFTNVWKGDYTLNATRFSYPVYAQTVSITGDATFNITMLQDKEAPTNLFVDDHSLVSTWNPPRAVKELFAETWTSGSFATNQWVEDPTTSNWQISTGVGNPAPSAMFSYSPAQTNYTMSLVSKNIVGVHAPIQQLKYDIFLDNYGTTNLNSMAIEVGSGTTWTTLKTYDNSSGSNIPWTSETLDISAYTHDTFKVRFRAFGEDSFDIDAWYVDNIYVIATDGTSGPNPCVIGYNFYLNNILSAFTVDTTYTIPASQVVYGQTYEACVKAVYGSGYSDPDCYTFVSHFLCPVADLTAEAVEDAAYLTWSKPSCSGGEAKCYIFDDGTMENGWAFNPGYSVWLGNKFIAPTTDQGTLTKIKMQWWNNASATVQNFQFDAYDLAGVHLGSSQMFPVPVPAPSGQMELVFTTPIPFQGQFYGMLHWNATGTTHWLGYDEDGPYISNNLSYAYDGATFTPWTTYAGAAPGVFCLQVCGLVSGDAAEVTFNAEPLANGTSVAAAGMLSHTPEGAEAPQLEPSNSDNAMAGTGLMGYNVYNHNGTFYQYVPGPDSLSTYVFGLDPGTYCFDVLAYYDLTVYGFPGQFDESIAQVGGPACITLNYGIDLPFFEPWDQGTFGYHDWSFQPSQGNWSVNTGLGNPAPAADFSWQPLATNYQYALVSPVIDASAWTCAEIWLDFDYKLEDRNATGNEKLNVDIFYGGSWKSKLELTNTGSVNWTPQHIDISGAKGKAFRVRFLANGASTEDILHWYVDNIHAYGICKAPTALDYDQSQFTTTLTWTAPECGGGQVVMNFIFDDGTAENGWGINPGYLAWIGNEFPIAATIQGVLQSFDIYFMANGAAGSDQPTIDVYDGTQTLVGSTAPFTPPTDDWLTVNVNDIPFAGMFYAMVKWNNFGASTNYLGVDEDGPYSSDDLTWYSDGAAWDKLSVVAGGAASVSLLRATALVGGDLKSVQLVAGAQPTRHMNVAAGTFAKANRSVDTYNHATMGIQKNASDSSTLMGYNVYRTDETGTGPYSLLNSAPVTVTTYVDTYPSTLEDGIFHYYVTSTFNDSETGEPLCESSSDTITVEFPAVGVNELTNGQVMVYPNPATENVTVKSSYTISGIEVMNFVGQTVYSNSNVAAKTAKVNVTTLRSGVYFVKVSTDQGVRTVKITVTH